MDPKCPFAATLSQANFNCEFAVEVIRRGGSEYDCQSTQQHPLCVALHGRLKQAALPAFEVEDDLLSMPHSVLVKIQFGGLLGLQRLLHPAETPAPEVADIASLVTQVVAGFGGVDEVPCEQVTADMTNYKVARRRR